jgi:hypothetical protein
MEEGFDVPSLLVDAEAKLIEVAFPFATFPSSRRTNVCTVSLRQPIKLFHSTQAFLNGACRI